MGKYLTAPVASRKLPTGIPFIIGNELAERFSFYGMRAILTVFMTKHLLDSAGQPDYMSEENAKAVYHLFTAAVYFFPFSFMKETLSAATVGSRLAELAQSTEIGGFFTVPLPTHRHFPIPGMEHLILDYPDALGDNGAGDELE